MIDRIPLKMVSAHLFFAIDGEPQHLCNEDFRTLAIHEWQTSRRKKHILNIVQLHRPASLRKLQMAYAEDCQNVEISLVETMMEEFEFGFGDVAPNAPFLVAEHSRFGSAAKVARWLRKSMTGDVLTVEGSKRTRISFANENDFVLARLNFS